MSNLELAVREHFKEYSSTYLSQFGLGEIMQSFYWNLSLEEAYEDPFEIASDISSAEFNEFEEIYEKLTSSV